jgi:hypothetical protein
VASFLSTHLKKNRHATARLFFLEAPFLESRSAATGEIPETPPRLFAVRY